MEHNSARYIGKDWKGRGLALVELKTFEDKLNIMRNKRKLTGQECYVKDDMTKREREIQAAIRKKAREARERGHEVKVGYQKIQINRKWETWEDIETSAAYKPRLQNNQSQPINPKIQAQTRPRSPAATSSSIQPPPKNSNPNQLQPPTN